MTRPGDEDTELYSTLQQLEAAFASGQTLPQDIDEVVEQLVASPTGLTADDLDRLRRRAVERLETRLSVGQLLKKRRIAVGLDEEEAARRAGWHADLLEELEEDRADLHSVDPERLGNLLHVLGLPALGSLEKPLRQLATAHLAVHGSGMGPIFGRSRKGVGTFARRRDLVKGVPGHDQEATRRAVDAFVIGVTDRLRELTSRRT